MTRVLVALVAVLGAVVVSLVVQLRRPSPAAPTVTRADPPPLVQLPAPPPPRIPDPPPARFQADVPATLSSGADVDRYLAQLEARTRASGQVTAAEVEPGLAAITQLYPPEEHAQRMNDFIHRLQRAGQ